MGFGTLFIGYFLVLNATYFGYTDLISGLVMTLAFYKLRNINKEFRMALGFAVAHSVVGLAELIETALSTFFPTLNSEIFLSYVAPLRHLVIGVLTAFMLLGIKSVAQEVGVSDLAARARMLLPFCYTVFAAETVLEFPILADIIPTAVLTITSTILILSEFILVIINLFAIYTAYMKICMPEDVDNDPKEKQSRFGFVNKFKAHEDEKRKEYADYKLEKFKNKINKKKRK